MGGRKGSEREIGRRSKWVRGRVIKEVGGGKERGREVRRERGVRSELMWEKRKWVRGKVRGKKRGKESLSVCFRETDRVSRRKSPPNIII